MHSETMYDSDEFIRANVFFTSRISYKNMYMLLNNDRNLHLSLSPHNRLVVFCCCTLLHGAYILL